MSIRTDRKEKTVRAILDAAAREFAETGFAGARVDRIADRAGANKAMIYYHIGDKQVLYSRVLHEVLGSTAERMARNIQAVDTPREKLRAYIRSIGKTVLEHPYMARIMMREMASGGQALPDIAIEDFAAIIGMVAEVISSGVASGEFEDLNPLTLHLMVIGGLTYCRAAGPIIARYPAQADAQAKIKDTGDRTALLDQVETIIISALRKNRCKE